jgi:flagellar hook-associated protein 3 FlgL
MRITFNEQTSGVASLQTAAKELARAQREVSTGRRVNTASDDPSAARTIVHERAETAKLDAYKRSADTAASRLSAADTALSGLIDLYTQAQSAATAGRGSVATVSSRQAIAASIRGIRASVLTSINAQFAGRPLFAGSAAGGSAYSGAPGGWTYQGGGSPVQLEVQPGRMVSVTFDGQEILQGADAENILDSLDRLADAIDAGNDAGIQAGLASLDNATARATRAQGRLGADERGVSDAGLQLTSLRLASDTRRSQAEDANMAEAITRMSAADTAYRATLAAISREERLTLLDYLR